MRDFRTASLIVLFLRLFVTESAVALELLRVAVAPVRGNARYPLVMNGLRQVLLADLAQTVQFKVAQEEYTEEQLSLASLGDPNNPLAADVIIFPIFVEGIARFTVVLRANDVSTGYSLGSQEINGSYNDIKGVQDRVFMAAIDLLRGEVSAKQRTDIAKTHTQTVTAVMALGEADVSLRDKNYVEAVERFSKSKSLDPDFRAPSFQLETVAQQLAQKVTQPDQLGHIYSYIGDSAKSMKEFDNALSRDPKNVRALVGKADLLLKMGKSAEALSTYQSAADLSPNDPTIYAGQAKSYQSMGKAAESVTALERARAFGATQPDVYESLGNHYASKNQTAQAANAYRTAAELSEKAVNLRDAQRNFARVNALAASASSMEREADMYIANGQPQIAVSILTKALYIDPNRDSVLAKLGYAYYLNEQPGEATKKLLRAYEVNPSNYDANLYLGIIYSNNKQTTKEAIKFLETACRLRTEAKEPRYILARLYVTEEKATAAAEILERLALIHTKDADLQKELGDAYFASGDFTHAEIAYNRATSLRPDFKEAHEGLAKTYIKMGNRDRAIATIEKVYGIDASNNFFLKEGQELLGTFSSKGLVELSLLFPKIVASGKGDVPVNQVGVVPLSEKSDLVEFAKRYLSLYIVDLKRIQSDLEIALFVQYRVLRGRQLGAFSGRTIPQRDFETESLMNPILETSKLDGLFGFKILTFAALASTATVTVDLRLYSLADRGLHGINDKTKLPKAAYNRSEIIRLNPRAIIGYGVLLLICLGPYFYFGVYRARKRGWGNVQVTINYDPKLESFLTLKLSTRQEKEVDNTRLFVSDKQKAKKKKYRQLLKQKGTWVRQMVGRVTTFDRVPAREYFCYLYGTIEDAIARNTIGNYYMVQRIVVEKGKTKPLVFQLEKEEAFVTVFVRKGEEDISGAEIWVQGQPDVKYSKALEGSFVYLKKGKHKVTVKHEGRSVAQIVNVIDLADKVININLLTAEEAEEEAISGRDVQNVAQEFESQGRLDDAARLYEKAGAKERAAELRVQSLVSEGNVEAAAEEMARVRDFIKAAELYRQAGQDSKANVMYGMHFVKEKDLQQAVKYLERSDAYGLLAKVYEQLGDMPKAYTCMAKDCLAKGQKIEAAQAYVKAGANSEAAELYAELNDPAKAAVLYAKDGNYPLAADHFVQAGDHQRAVLAFEKASMYEQAIDIYKELGEMDKVIALCERAEQYFDAATLYQTQGLTDQAIASAQKVSPSHMDFFRAQLLLGQLFSSKGMTDLALKTFSNIYQNRPSDFDPDTLYAYADLLEKSGKFGQSLEMFERLLRQDFHFKDVALRIKKLKGKAKEEQSVAATAKMGETIAGKKPKEETRYEILGELGRGSMGVVFKARDKMLDRIVAFKTLPHTLKDDAEALENLIKEAQTAAKLNHPNIVTIFDVGEEGGNYFMAMEYVEGKTLQQVLKQVKKVSLNNMLAIARPLCEVVAYAHEQRVIHRDIKPSNIILLPNRTVKLMDFGLARVLQDMAIDKTMLRGTPLYMSPEQVLGKDIDHRTDLYSLGVLFYRMLAGTPPFSQGDIMYAHMHTPPPPLSTLVKGAPPQILETIMSCLAKDKNDRPKSAKELWSAIASQT